MNYVFCCILCWTLFHQSVKGSLTCFVATHHCTLDNKTRGTADVATTFDDWHIICYVHVHQ